VKSYQGEEAVAVLREWLERQGRFAFRVVESSKEKIAPITLIEIEHDKRLTFAWGEIARVEEARIPQLDSKYLRVLLGDGRSFAVSGVGFVFAPSFASTGPLEECPETACFADFWKLERHLEHLITEENREREALQVLMVLLAYLDGARAVGLSVSEEEETLDSILKKLEERGVSI
jgi:hypothetical protein